MDVFFGIPGLEYVGTGSGNPQRATVHLLSPVRRNAVSSATDGRGFENVDNLALDGETAGRATSKVKNFYKSYVAYKGPTLV